MDVRAFDFSLPTDLIAQDPLADRSAARLLVLDRGDGSITHSIVATLPDRLSPGDLVVVNDTRVFPARLLGHRVPSGGAVECLLIRPLGGTDGSDWEALMHPGQKLAPGARVVFDGAHPISGEVIERRFFGRRIVRLRSENGTPLDAAIDAIGHVPLPPYIKRDDRPEDRERYQTVFAHERGSVAAPTAGLHFTPALVERLKARGVEMTSITLHVGYGTFQPVRVERVEDHRVESERYTIGARAADAINHALDGGRRIIAVGTTTTRTLESVARDHGGRVAQGSGTTDLFIYPGFPFQVLGGLLTNFHLPKSSLLMLVAAFGGFDAVRNAYHAAVAERYRFYSYGDAMLIV
ncbi:MAG TPA: tRNA preQ1(34) S-adenosylmethionine ribosyltransferase-isomerase QueA [Vicinamibacterales bacterium]|nr:tRNA preQ1(34) S-adenosylmethionine ribosyltransferase-isomerase QueA [Vicinamibacterales bacterium]